MNLTTGEWIPVVWEDGKADKVSLLDVFQEGDSIRDLAVRPHERIALMRLLICVAQAALNGPKNRADWQTCRSRLPQAVTDYLGKWKDAFELFGDRQRFLQVANVVPTKTGEDKNPPLASKLDMALATGSASTLFDNAGGELRPFDPSEMALMLLTFQCFSPGGLLSECLWNGTRTKKAGNVAAPCLAGKMVHTYLLDRTSLLRSVWLNLLNKDQLRGKQAWGVPVWERMPTGPTDRSGIENASSTYVGRLTPVCRAVCLSEAGITMTWGCAIDYPTFDDSGWRDPTGTVFLSRNPKGETVRRQLGGSVDRSLWRELGAMVVLDHTGENQLGGPFALENAVEQAPIDVFAGAAVHAKGKTTTILNIVESVLHIPLQLFANTGQRLYQTGVDQASKWAARLNYAVSACHRAMKDELDKTEFRKRGNLVKAKAVSHYWTAIEQKVALLLALVEDPAPLRPDGSVREQWGATDWGKALVTAAREAYELACPRTTPRQLQAYAAGLNVLFRPIEEDQTDERNTEEDTNEGSMD
jgi:CRISPR system Cascade subunit CasA